MDELIMLEKIERDLQSLKKQMEELSYKLNYVEVKNGDNMLLRLKKDEFFQKLYNKPDKKDVIQIVETAVKQAPINSIRTIIRDITLIVGMITILLKMFGIIH